MEKVYCKNCKWNGGWFYNYFPSEKPNRWPYCEKTVSLKSEYFSDEHFVRRVELNTSGKCPYYQRQWCKFWVK